MTQPVSGEDPGSESPAAGPMGAYGLRIEGLDGAVRLLHPSGADWKRVRIVRERGEPTTGRPLVSIGADRAELLLGSTRTIAVERLDGSVRLTAARDVSDEVVVHPYLAFPAAVFSRWNGREVFHAGVFGVGDKAWALMTPKGMGKSSTLGWLALHGYPVFSDDLLVLDGTTVHAGPRSIDLRQEAADRLGAGTRLEGIEGRERFRMELGPTPAEVTLGGVVFLEWGPDIELTRLPAAERLRRLFLNEGLSMGPVDPGAYVELAGLPAWELKRPPVWDSLRDATTMVLDAIADRG